MLSVAPLRILLPVLASAGLALLANGLLTGEPLTRMRELDPLRWGGAQTAGSIILLLAVAAAAWAFGGGDDYPHAVGSAPDPKKKAGRGSPPTGSSQPFVPRWTAFLPAAALWLASSVLFATAGETALVRWLWLGSIVAFALPFLRDRSPVHGSAPMSFGELALLGAIVAGAALVRGIDLTSLPRQVDNDVSLMGLFSRRLVEMDSWRFIGMAPTRHPYSEHQFIGLGMRLFGHDHFGLAMHSVIAGTASCVVLHLIGRLVFNRWVGLIAAALLAANWTHLHFSRLLFGPLATLFVLLASWLLLQGLRYGRARDFALGGACVSLAAMDYYSGRIGPVLAVGLAGLWFWQRHQFPHVRFKLWWIGFGGALVVFGPNVAYLIDEFQRFSGRGNHVLIWTEEAWRHLSLKYQSGGSVWIVLKEQILRAALAPFYFPDESTICYLRRPMLGAVAAAGLTLGLGFCVRRWRQPACAFPVFSVIAVLVLGGVLTIDPPYWPHLNIAVPALCLIAAIGIERLARRVHEALPPRASSAVPSLVVFCLLATAVHEWEVYEEFARRHAGGRIHAVREIQQLPAGSRVYLVSNAVRADQESFRFLTPQVSVRNLSPEDLRQKSPRLDAPLAFFVFDDAPAEVRGLLEQAYPGCRVEGFLDGWNLPVFTAFYAHPPGLEVHPQTWAATSRRLSEMPGGWIAILTGFALIVLFVQRFRRSPIPTAK
jgi:hypothetical protein